MLHKLANSFRREQNYWLISRLFPTILILTIDLVTMTSIGINDLYSRLINGDTSAENELFQKLTVSFGLFVEQRIQDESDAQEVVQDSLMVIARKLKNLEISTSFSAWAYKTLQYELLHYYRSKGYRERTFVHTDELNQMTGTYELDPKFRIKLLDCLKQLSQTQLRYAQALTLRFQGYSPAEIARKLDISSNNFYVTLSRARSLLKDCLNTGAIDT